MRELAPKATVVAMLGQSRQSGRRPRKTEVQAVAQVIGLQLKMFTASTPAEIDSAFAAITTQRPDALLVSSDPFLLFRRDSVVPLAARLGFLLSTRFASLSPPVA